MSPYRSGGSVSLDSKFHHPESGPGGKYEFANKHVLGSYHYDKSKELKQSDPAVSEKHDQEGQKLDSSTGDIDEPKDSLKHMKKIGDWHFQQAKKYPVGSKEELTHQELGAVSHHESKPSSGLHPARQKQIEEGVKKMNKATPDKSPWTMYSHAYDVSKKDMGKSSNPRKDRGPDPEMSVPHNPEVLKDHPKDNGHATIYSYEGDQLKLHPKSEFHGEVRHPHTGELYGTYRLSREKSSWAHPGGQTWLHTKNAPGKTIYEGGSSKDTKADSAVQEFHNKRIGKGLKSTAIHEMHHPQTSTETRAAIDHLKHHTDDHTAKEQSALAERVRRAAKKHGLSMSESKGPAAAKKNLERKAKMAKKALEAISDLQKSASDQWWAHQTMEREDNAGDDPKPIRKATHDPAEHAAEALVDHHYYTKLGNAGLAKEGRDAYEKAKAKGVKVTPDHIDAAHDWAKTHGPKIPGAEHIDKMSDEAHAAARAEVSKAHVQFNLKPGSTDSGEREPDHAHTAMKILDHTRATIVGDHSEARRLLDSASKDIANGARPQSHHLDGEKKFYQDVIAGKNKMISTGAAQLGLRSHAMAVKHPLMNKESGPSHTEKVHSTYGSNEKEVKKAMTARSMPRMPRALRDDTYRSATAVMTREHSGIAKDMHTGPLTGQVIDELKEEEHNRTTQHPIYKSCNCCGRTYMVKSMDDACPTCSVNKSQYCQKCSHHMIKSNGNTVCPICG